MIKTKHRYKLKDKKEKFESKDILILRSRTLKLSQSLFADLFGVSKQTVNSWECGWRKPSQMANTLMSVYKTNPNLLIEQIRGKE